MIVHLREVHLRNWRSYRTASFRFPAAKRGQRVILIGAMNGAGKTSLLVALYLGLFGREAVPFLEGVRLGGSEDEQVRSYRELMKRILHRQALNTDDPLASVELVFDTSDGEQVKITRVWHYTRGGVPRDFDTDGEEIRIDDNGKVRRPATWQDANNKIADLLFPAHVMPCFFFDGEQAQARVDASGAVALRDAINAVFGAGLLGELDDSLRNYINNQRSKTKQAVGDVREDVLEQKRRRRNELDDELSRINKELPKVSAELEAAEAARKEKYVELTQLTGDAQADINIYAQRKVDLEKQESELKTRLCDSLAFLALPMALRKHGAAAARRLESEMIRDRWLLLRDETLAKVDSIVAKALPSVDGGIDPALTADQHAQLAARLRGALESLWSPPPEGCADDFHYLFLGASDRTATANRIQTLASAGTVDAAALAGEWQAVKNKLRETQRRWDEMRDLGPRLEEIRNRLSELDEKIRGLNAAKANLESAERNAQAELKDLRPAIANMETMQRKLGPVEAKLDVAEKVREAINDSRERLIPLCRAALEETCTTHFRGMITNEYRRYVIQFDGNLQPMLVAPDQPPIYVTTLSGAQKRAFGLAFTLAVAEVSGQEAPLVIDTPVGNMDSEYRKRVLSYLAKSAPGQVFFLSHNEEIYGEYVRELEPSILQKYLVTFEEVGDGVGISKVNEGRYFNQR